MHGTFLTQQMKTEFTVNESSNRALLQDRIFCEIDSIRLIRFDSIHSTRS
jgi:hypothetical protein